ncbi:MAG: murein biosynthesis integral membrane protein MurJ [Chloroflexota bacterium]|nr:murein biosynthesis integral membrane protein MurJ [Chloroflexota bacterium]MDE2947021.1 murein biosynthesis integral membrane protein MurJ [Chloroflexota bacterium]
MAAQSKDRLSLRQRNRRIARSTLTVMVAFAAAKLISLVQTLIIARVFGVGSDLDAYVAANRIPELIVILISGGALTHAFIPIFSGLLAKGDLDTAWKLSSNLINAIFSLALLLSLAVFVLAPWLVSNAVAPGFDAVTARNTVDMMRILLLSTIIFAVSGIFSGILNSHQHFLLPALAPIMFDIGILAGVLFLLPRFGVHGIAWGAVLGAALHFSIQLPGLLRYRMRWRFELGLSNPLLWRVIRLMLPRIGGLGVFSLNFLVMNNIASRLGVGSVSALDWGWRLMQIPQTLVGTAMGIVIFPTLAALSEMDDLAGKRDAMSGALRFILVSSIPSAIGLIVLGRPLISLLERGAFDSSASALVYSTLSMFTLGLIVHSALEVIARSFYADKDTLTPLFAALGGALINFTAAILLSDARAVDANALLNAAADAFPALGLRREIGEVSGLALANSLGVMFEVLALLVILRRRWHGIGEKQLARTLAKTLAASLVMAAVIVLIDMIWLAMAPGQGLTFTMMRLAVEGLIGLLVFFVVALLLKMKEISELWAIIRPVSAS